MPYKIKVTQKKEVLREPNKMLNGFTGILDSIRENYRLYTVIGTVLVVVAIGTGMSLLYNYNMHKKAAILEYKADTYLKEVNFSSSTDDNKNEEKDYTKAIELYQKILKDYPGSRVAPIAQYQLGNIYFEKKRYDKALESYKTFIDRYKDNPLLLSLVYQKLGYVYLTKQDYPQAIDAFKNVISMDSAYNKDQSYYEIGYINELSDKKEEAIEMYERIIKESPHSPLATDAEKRLKELDTTSEKSEEKTGDIPEGKAEEKIE